jgi:hypothetical protein
MQHVCIQNAYRILVGKPKRTHWKEIRFSGRTTTGTFKDWCVKAWSGFI